jgi:precorrin-2 dehydrogenase/sirohydrochlorin ferrochelatase
MNYYPVYLNLEGKKVVVIGGGRVAERKVFSLLKAGASVTVVSPEITTKLMKAKRGKSIRHVSSPYQKKNLAGAFLVIAATDNPAINSRVAHDTTGLVNVVDVPSECNFIAPSVIKRGQLMIAISTSGSSPALSRSLRKEIEMLYGPEFSSYLNFIKRVRANAITGIKNRVLREKFLKSLASERMLKLLRSKGIHEAKHVVLEKFSKLQDKS